jgi:rhodanese-related sulfurtransferase
VSTTNLEIDCRAVKARLDAGDPIVLLDCRERDEHDFVRLASAKFLPMSELMQRVSELDAYRNSELIVYCHHGGRSLRVAVWLRQQGFANARSMAGGIDQWSQEIDPALPRY